MTRKKYSRPAAATQTVDLGYGYGARNIYDLLDFYFSRPFEEIMELFFGGYSSWNETKKK